MSAASAMGRLQIGSASLVYQAIDATGGGAMPFVFQHGWAATRTSPSAISEMHRPAQ